MYALSAVTVPTPSPAAPAISPAAQTAAAAIRTEPCWHAELANCVDTGNPSTLPSCPTIRAGYAGTAADKAMLDEVVNAMPFCPLPTTDWKLVLGAAAIGVALGVVIRSVIG